jgi:hypothetical protein
MMSTNLDEMAVELACLDDIRVPLNVLQIKEVIDLLGIRWRKMAHDDFLDEVMVIRHQGGVSG